MRRIIFALLLSATVTVLAQPVSSTSSGVSATATSPLPALTGNDACSKEITIYIDLSGSMTTRSPNQPLASRVPLNDIADTLHTFVTNNDFVRSGDTVSVKYFGTIVKTVAQDRTEAADLLESLADPGRWQSALTGTTATDFQRLTDFVRLVSDLRDRVKSAAAQRQIIFIASDFAHDDVPSDGCVDNVQPRLATFAGAAGTLIPLLQHASAPDDALFGRLQIAGIYTPPPRCSFDAQVATSVRGQLEAAGVRMYRYDEDATEAARTLRNSFVGSVKAKPADTLVRVGADDRVGFKVTNPNCDSVDVIGLTFRGATAAKTVDVNSATVTNGSAEVRVKVDDIVQLWNQDVTVTPVLRGPTEARTEPSDLFWLGNWVRIRQLSPYAYPRLANETSSTLVTASVLKNVRTTGSVVISGIEPGGRARAFDIRGEGDETLTFAFRMTPASLAALLQNNPTASIAGNGLRVVFDSQPSASALDVPLASTVVAQTEEILSGIRYGAYGLLLILLPIIGFRTFLDEADRRAKRQWESLFGRFVKLLWPGLTTLGLQPPLGGIPLPLLESQVWLLVGIRALLASLTVYFILRALLVEALWSGIFERHLLPHNVAVSTRGRVNATISVLSLLVFLVILHSFFVAPIASPPPLSDVLGGVLR